MTEKRESQWDAFTAKQCVVFFSGKNVINSDEKKCKQQVSRGCIHECVYFFLSIPSVFFHFSCCYLSEESVLLLFEAFMSATGSTSLSEKAYIGWSQLGLLW